MRKHFLKSISWAPARDEVPRFARYELALRTLSVTLYDELGEPAARPQPERPQPERRNPSARNPSARNPSIARADTRKSRRASVDYRKFVQAWSDETSVCFDGMTKRALQALERFFEPGAPPLFTDDAPSPTRSRLCRDRPGSPDTIGRRFELGQAIVAQSDACSLRDLSKALGGRVSRTFLHRCTTAYRLGRTFPFILESDRLRVSHLDAVERLARPVQGRLLLEADHGNWSVRKLRERALAERAPSNSSVNIKAARRALTQLRLSLSALAGHEPFTAAATRATLEEICSGLAEARELSASLLGNQPGMNA